MLRTAAAPLWRAAPLAGSLAIIVARYRTIRVISRRICGASLPEQLEEVSRDADNRDRPGRR